MNSNLRNDLSINQRVKRKFLRSTLGEIFKEEENALDARNDQTHGSLKEKDMQEHTQHRKVFMTLIHKVILKILNYSGEYIDYGTYDKNGYTSTIKELK